MAANDRPRKISDLPVANTVGANDTILIVSNGITSKMSRDNFLKLVTKISVQDLVVTNNVAPANSSANSTQGSIFYDPNYLYITVQNNVTKRVPLTTF